MLQIFVLFLIPGLFGDVDGYFQRVCEGGHLSINCDSEVLDIKSASYGRTQKGVCAPNGLDSNILCYSASSMKVTLHRCQGQHRCTVHATKSEFGDPCSGTDKYLEVSYNCVPKRPHHSTLLQVCEHGVHEIRCKPSKKIEVLSANYGRLTGGHVCGGGPIRTTHCGAAEALSKVRTDCQGRPRCVLHAVNTKFGDPCPGTYKYLEVSYNCVSKRPHHSTMLQVCEHGVHEIRCKPSKKIEVLSANYGRLTGGHVCGGGPIRTTHCGAAGALSKVRTDCQGRPRCVLHAVNTKFGDPCPGTYKYLEVRYRCKK